MRLSKISENITGQPLRRSALQQNTPNLKKAALRALETTVFQPQSAATQFNNLIKAS
jgi:hypothetical protein